MLKRMISRWAVRPPLNPHPDRSMDALITPLSTLPTADSSSMAARRPTRRGSGTGIRRLSPSSSIPTTTLLPLLLLVSCMIDAAGAFVVRTPSWITGPVAARHHRRPTPLAAASPPTAAAPAPTTPTPIDPNLSPVIPSLLPPDFLSGVERVADCGGRLRLKGALLHELEALLLRLGYDGGDGGAGATARRLFRWIYHKDYMIESFSEATEARAAFKLPKRLVEDLDRVATLDGGLRLAEVKVAGDGTRKLVLEITSGPGRGKAVEAVIIPMVRGPDQRPRYTLCISSQSGCAMACDFCRTGQMGLLGSLSAGQIVEQLLLARKHLRAVGDATPILRIVFMGMGEPFDNYDAVTRALGVLTEQAGKMLLGPRKVTVSTVGLVPQMERFLQQEKPPAMLAVSLHATTDEIRNGFMPVNRRWPLAELMACLHRHFPLPGKSSSNGGGSGGGGGGGRRKGPVALEYVMLDGVNDAAEDAHRLARMTEGLDCVVNLIEFNTHEGALFRGSPRERIQEFRAVLKSYGRLSTLRESKGAEEMGACGQLGDLAMARKFRPRGEGSGGEVTAEGGEQ